MRRAHSPDTGCPASEPVLTVTRWRPRTGSRPPRRGGRRARSGRRRSLRPGNPPLARFRDRVVDELVVLVVWNARAMRMFCQLCRLAPRSPYVSAAPPVSIHRFSLSVSAPRARSSRTISRSLKNALVRPLILRRRRRCLHRPVTPASRPLSHDICDPRAGWRGESPGVNHVDGHITRRRQYRPGN
jgi:hypothetical protein